MSTKKFTVSRMTEDELKAFVAAWCRAEIFSVAHIAPDDMGLVQMVFMPLALGAFADADEAEIKNIGIVYEYYYDPKTARCNVGPRGVNGYPVFYSLRVMHKLDWAIVAPAIERHEKKLREVEL